MIPPLLDRLYKSKRMLVVIVYLSMLLDNILLTVVVPIIPDYLYSSEQQDNVVTEKNILEFPRKELAVSNNPSSPECLDNHLSSDLLPTHYTDSDRSLEKGGEAAAAIEELVLTHRKVSGRESDIYSKNLNGKKEEIDTGMENNQQTPKMEDHPYGNWYIHSSKEGTFRYESKTNNEKYFIWNKDENNLQYSTRDIRGLLNPKYVKFHSVYQYEKQKSFGDHLLTGRNDMSYADDGSNVKFKSFQRHETGVLGKTEEHKIDKVKKVSIQSKAQNGFNIFRLMTNNLNLKHGGTTASRCNRTHERNNSMETSFKEQHPFMYDKNENSFAKSEEGIEKNSSHRCNTSNDGIKEPHTTSQTIVLFTPHGIIDENGRVGLLLSSKALVQLVMNPIVGAVTVHVGYHLPLFVGSINLLVASLLFAFGERFMALLLARSLQGIASACISVSGMCLVAEQFPDDVIRSRIMGIVLGSMALGVLLGYPFGSLMYDFVGKMAPFLIISAIVFLNGVLQLFFLDLKPVPDRVLMSTSWHRLLSDGHVVLIAGAIWLSTSTMAILEPCMPIWLMDNIKPQKWQLGMVFIPDSIGYLLGTNFFGSVAYHLGRWRVAISAMMLVGISTVLVPSAGSVSQLALPHFGLGLGIGVVDAALVPLLASLMDSRYAAHYASVYALQQMAVSLAYSLGPLVGGEMVRTIGFPWLMRSVGLLNLLYCPLLIFTSYDSGNSAATLHSSLVADAPTVNYKTSTNSDPQASNKNLYRRFLNSEDSD